MREPRQNKQAHFSMVSRDINGCPEQRFKEQLTRAGNRKNSSYKANQQVNNMLNK
jgi:hypothetical protein